MPLRTAQAKLAVLPEYADREELGELAGRRVGEDERASGASCRRRPRRSRPSCRGDRRPGRAQRGREAHLAAPARRRARRRERAASTDVYGDACASAGSTGCSAPSAAPLPSSCHAAYMRRLSPLEDVYTKERATEICLATLEGARASTSPATRTSARPRGPSAEDAAAVRDRVRPADRRPPDHTGPGRAPRLPGASCTRPATRSTTPAATRPAVHVPRALARPRADRDLLVHRRVDHARAGLARAALRPLATSRRARTRRRRRSSTRFSSGATRRSSTTRSTSGRASPRTAARPRATPSG